MERDGSRSGPSRPIGSLVTEALPSLSRKAETWNGSTERGRAAAITTSARGTSLPTSTRHGEPGSVTRTNLPAILSGSTALAMRARRNPAVLLPQRLTSCLDVAWADGNAWGEDGDTGYGWDGYVCRYELAREPLADDLAQAIEVAEVMLEEADERFVIAELTRLRVLTVSRGQSTADLELLIAAYADELKKFPPDAIREVLRGYPRSHRFWPSISELLEPLERAVAPRRALLDGLRRGYRQPETSPDWVAPTAEQIAEAEALLREHGLALDGAGRVRPPEREPMTAKDHAQMQAELAEFRARWAAAEGRGATA